MRIVQEKPRIFDNIMPTKQPTIASLTQRDGCSTLFSLSYDRGAFGLVCLLLAIFAMQVSGEGLY